MQKDETSSIPHGGAKTKPTLTDNLPPTKHHEFKPFPRQISWKSGLDFAHECWQVLQVRTADFGPASACRWLFAQP
jgi:hypothetical protein